MLGQKGRQYAMERYAFEQALNQYEALFKSVATQAPSRLPVLPELVAEKSLVDL
ncbi:MAG TPA: hypothetical protein V6D04_06310 [Candidatus Obscuribacterales bacterium]